MPKVITYSILLAGERGVTFRVEGWQGGLTAENVGDVLSTVTGYRTEYIQDELARAMKRSRLGVWEIAPANGFGGVPRFLVSRDNASRTT